MVLFFPQTKYKHNLWQFLVCCQLLSASSDKARVEAACDALFTKFAQGQVFAMANFEAIAEILKPYNLSHVSKAVWSMTRQQLNWVGRGLYELDKYASDSYTLMIKEDKDCHPQHIDLKLYQHMLVLGYKPDYLAKITV